MAHYFVNTELYCYYVYFLYQKEYGGVLVCGIGLILMLSLYFVFVKKSKKVSLISKYLFTFSLSTKIELLHDVRKDGVIICGI